MRQVERLAAQKPPREEGEKSGGERMFIEAVERRMTDLIGHKVTLAHGKKRGRLSIEYYGNEDLEQICQLLEAGELK